MEKENKFYKEDSDESKSDAREKFEQLREKMIRKEKRYLPEEFLVKINSIIPNYLSIGLKEGDIDKEAIDLKDEEEKYFTQYRELIENNKELVREKQMWVLHEVLQNFNKSATVEKIDYYSPSEFNELYKRMNNLILEIGLRERMVKKLNDVLTKGVASRVKNPVTIEMVSKSHQELMDKLQDQR